MLYPGELSRQLHRERRTVLELLFDCTGSYGGDVADQRPDAASDGFRNSFLTRLWFWSLMAWDNIKVWLFPLSKASERGQYY